MKALIIMDMQEITVGKNHAQMFTYDVDLLHRINQRIKQFDGENVYYCKNLMKKSFLNCFAPVQVFQDSPEGELAEGLLRVSDNIFEKYKPDAFSNMYFDECLRNRGVTKLEIIGVDGGGCVAYTALGACKKGYEVTLNTKCIGTVLIKSEEKLRKKLDKAGIIVL